MRLKAVLPLLAFATARASSIPLRLSVSYPPDAIVRPEDGFLYEAGPIAPGVRVLQSPEPFHFGPLGNVAVIEQTDGFPCSAGSHFGGNAKARRFRDATGRLR
jgi:hypothetical protein